MIWYDGAMIRIAFFDIDGTVLSHTSDSVPVSAIQGIHALQERGILVFGCTGRHKLELERLPLDGFAPDGWVLMNGSLDLYRDTVIDEKIIDRDTAVKIGETMAEEKIPCQFLERDYMYMNFIDDAVLRGLAEIHTAPDPTDSIERLKDHALYMFIPWCSGAERERVLARFPSVQAIGWNDQASDCMSVLAGKGAGVRAVLQYLHMDKEEAIGFGDAGNDLDMFAACGTSVAMGNGSEEAKAAADYVTGGIDEDGLYEALKVFHLLG